MSVITTTAPSTQTEETEKSSVPIMTSTMGSQGVGAFIAKGFDGM